LIQLQPVVEISQAAVRIGRIVILGRIIDSPSFERVRTPLPLLVIDQSRDYLSGE
jgi:hypothetical protein